MEQQLNINLKDTQSVICEKCDNNIFIEGVMLRKASRFVTMTSQDALIPIPIFACSKCAHVNEAFLPIQLRQNEIDEDDQEDNQNIQQND